MTPVTTTLMWQVGRFEPLLEPFALSCQLHKDDAAGEAAEV